MFKRFVVRALAVVMIVALASGGCVCAGGRIFRKVDVDQLEGAPKEPRQVTSAIHEGTDVLWTGIWDGEFVPVAASPGARDIRCRYVRLSSAARSMLMTVGTFQALRVPPTAMEITSQSFTVRIDHPADQDWFRTLYTDRVVAWGGRLRGAGPDAARLTIHMKLEPIQILVASDSDDPRVVSYVTAPAAAPPTLGESR